MTCILESISQNPFACEEIWIWDITYIAINFALVVAVTIWMMRASYFIRLEREQALLDDVMLGEDQQTCFNCGSIVTNRKKNAQEAQTDSAVSKINPEWQLPYARICEVCQLVGMGKVWVVFQFFFLGFASLFWFFGISAFVSYLCNAIITVYMVILFGRFVWTVGLMRGARRNALLCCGGDLKRRVNMLAAIDATGQQLSERTFSAETMQVLNRLPSKHSNKVISILKDDEQVLWAEHLSPKLYFKKNYDALFTSAMLGYIVSLFICFTIWFAIAAESMIILLPIFSSFLVWAPWIIDHYPKTKASYILTDRRVIALTPGLFFFHSSTASIYYAKMKTVILQLIESSSNTKEGRVIWMREQENVFSRLVYVSDIEQVGRIIRDHHPFHISNAPNDNEEGVGAQQSEHNRSNSIEISHFATPTFLSMKTTIGYQRLARFIQPTIMLVAFIAAAFWFGFSAGMIVFLIFLGICNALSWFIMLDLMYRKYLYTANIKQFTLNLVAPTSLPSSVQQV